MLHPSIHLRSCIISTSLKRLNEFESQNTSTKNYNKTAPTANGYTIKEMQKNIKARHEDDSEPNKPSSSKAFLLYVPRVTGRVGKVLKHINLKTIHKPRKKISC